MEPTLLVVGGFLDAAVRQVAALYWELAVEPSIVALRTAELIKYACNARRGGDGEAQPRSVAEYLVCLPEASALARNGFSRNFRRESDRRLRTRVQGKYRRSALKPGRAAIGSADR
jgi:hypothetical protein